MKTVRKWPPGHRRAGVMALGAATLLIVSYAVSRELHRRAVRRVNAASEEIARGEWLAAIRSLDRARWEDPYLDEAYLLRATAINGQIASIGPGRGPYSRQDALADLDWYLRRRPESGEAHYQRGLALGGLARVEPARQELALAIPLLDDPADAFVGRAGLSFHVGDRETAVREMTAAIERHPLVPDYYDERAFYRRALRDLRGARADRTRAALLRDSNNIGVEELEARVHALVDDTPISKPQDAPARSAEHARFMGKWQVVARESHGESVDTTDRDFSITFGKDRYRLVLDGKTQQDAAFWLDPERQPRRIDWAATINGKERRILGVYEFRGETLMICLGEAGDARPTGLTTSGFDPEVLYTLRRFGQPQGD